MPCNVYQTPFTPENYVSTLAECTYDVMRRLGFAHDILLLPPYGHKVPINESRSRYVGEEVAFELCSVLCSFKYTGSQVEGLKKYMDSKLLNVPKDRACIVREWVEGGLAMYASMNGKDAPSGIE